MTSKAAFVAMPGDPFVSLFFFKFFLNVWQDEVDKLYVHLNSPIEKKVYDFIVNFLTSHYKVDLIQMHQANDHGPSIKDMLQRCNEDLIMLIEDDAIVFKHNAITDAFTKITSGACDAVGSPRGSCSQNLIDASKDRYNLNYEGYGDKGPNFWPNFFFCKKEDLLQTDLHFGSKKWNKGDYISQLDLHVDETDTIGDTFVWASIQLRGLGLKFKEVPQYHAHPNDLEEYENKQNLWDGNCPWFHLGSVSSGIFGILRDDEGKPLAYRLDPNTPKNPNLPNYVNSEGERWEFERRVMYWSFCYEQIKDECSDIAYFGELYEKAIDRIINEYDLDRSRIEKRKQIYKELMGK